MTLSSFAADLRQALGMEHESERRRSRRLLKLPGAAALVATMALGLWWTAAPGDTSRLETHGLTSEETVLLDVATESAESFALIDEHTAAIQHYQEIARWWQARVAPEDPRIAWNLAHEAWVRTLAGDRLTAEQLLNDAPGWMARELGDRHPYTRAVRLGLAATLEARGAPEAASLRAQAEDATRALLQGTGDEPQRVNDVPAPPGVLAHVAPNPPEREGFRRAGEGRYFKPLTSMQRWNAGRQGWRLHIVAHGTCRASFVTGTAPRFVAVNAMRTADKSWRVRVEGTKPEMTLHATVAETVGVSLAANSSGPLRATVGGAKTLSSSIDTTSPPPNPPYTFTFDGAGCAVVWLEIPFPRTVLKEN